MDVQILRQDWDPLIRGQVKVDEGSDVRIGIVGIDFQKPPAPPIEVADRPLEIVFLDPVHITFVYRLDVVQERRPNGGPFGFTIGLCPSIRPHHAQDEEGIKDRSHRSAPPLTHRLRQYVPTTLDTGILKAVPGFFAIREAEHVRRLHIRQDGIWRPANQS